MIRMTDTKDLIGPLPEMPKTPVAPTPWKVNLPNYPEQILDAAGNAVGDFANEAVAELVMKLINAAATGTPKRLVSYWTDIDGDRWAQASNGLLYAAYDRQAAERVALREGDRSGRYLGDVADAYGPLSATYADGGGDVD